MATLQTGEYLIINKQTGQALDGNVRAATQASHAHPRAFMYQPTPQAPNHKWIVERQYNGTYLIKTRFIGGEMALDGNTGVPQVCPSHPAPFLYQATPSAPNHRWWLRPTGEYNTFLIVNESNGLALDGNVQGAPNHADHNHKSPFLWQPTAHAPNHQWVFQLASAPYPQTHYQPQPQPHYAPPVQPHHHHHHGHHHHHHQSHIHTNGPLHSGKYIIVNKSNGMCIDANYSAARQTSHGHPRAFLWSPNNKSKNHHWEVQHLGNGEYILVSAYHHPKMALDANTGVPQYTPSHPQPFLYQASPDAPNHRWRLVRAPTSEPNVFLIVSSANGKALDGNVNAIGHADDRHKSPFLYDRVDSAPNHWWHFQQVQEGCSTQ